MYIKCACCRSKYAVLQQLPPPGRIHTTANDTFTPSYVRTYIDVMVPVVCILITGTIIPAM